MLRVTLDTNVYVSGLNFKGKPYELLELKRAGQFEVTVSEAILSELRRVLHDKFEWPESDIATVERQIRGFARVVEPKQKLDVMRDDPADKRHRYRAARRPFVVSARRINFLKEGVHILIRWPSARKRFRILQRRNALNIG